MWIDRFHKYGAVMRICAEQLFLTERLRQQFVSEFKAFVKTVGDVGKKKAVVKREAAAAKSGSTTEVGAIAKEGNAGAVKKKRPVRCIQQYTDVEFRREFREVFEALAEKAKAGSTAETKLLLQIGKFGDPKVAKRRGGKSLSEMLMDELKRRQDEREAAEDAGKANDASNEGAKSGDEAE